MERFKRLRPVPYTNLSIPVRRTLWASRSWRRDGQNHLAMAASPVLMNWAVRTTSTTYDRHDALPFAVREVARVMSQRLSR